MKKLLLLILFISITFLGYSQYNITQNLGGPTTLVQNPNYGGFRGGLIPYTFSDTTSANSLASLLKLYNGALIYCTADNAVYWRDATNQKWVQLLPSGGTGGLSAWLTTGNFAVPTDVNGYAKFGTFGTNGINVITSGNTVFKIHADGIVPDTGTVQGLGVNSYGELSYFSGGGGSTPTWQQTLTAGSTLTQSNDITGAFAFSFTDPTSFTINKSGTARLQINTGTSSLRTSGGNAVLLLSSGTANLIGNTFVTLQSSNSEVGIYPDSILINPPIGFLKIDTINNETFQNTLMGWTSTSGTNRGKVGYITIGSGLSLSSGVLSATGGSGITIGSTTITSGTNTRILYNNSGVVGEYSVTGTGTTAVLSTSPTFTTSLLSPIVYGGSSSGGNLTIQSTSNGTKGKIFFGATSYVDEANTKNYLTGTTDVGGTAYGDASVILSLNNQTGAGTILGAYTSGAARFSIDQNGNTKQENGSLIGSASGTRDASSILEVRGTTGGVLMPRMTATQASAIGSPADGLIVYVTDTNGTFTAIGFWGRVSGAWTQL